MIAIHRESGRHYHVLDLDATDKSNDNAPVVVYRRESANELYVREKSEFIREFKVMNMAAYLKTFEEETA